MLRRVQVTLRVQQRIRKKNTLIKYFMNERKTFIRFGTAADSSIDYLLAILEDARITTLRGVVGISIEELHWQYDKGWNTIGCLLAHMVSLSHVFRISFIEGRPLTDEETEEMTPGLEMGKYIPQLITGEPIESYIAQLEASMAKMVAQVQQLSKEDFWQRIEYYDPETGSNLAWVLYHLAEDEVHHRGQISIIRKLYKHLAPSRNA